MDINEIAELSEKEFLKKYSVPKIRYERNILKVGDLVRHYSVNPYPKNINKIILINKHSVVCEKDNEITIYSRSDLRLLDDLQLIGLRKKIIQTKFGLSDIHKAMKLLNMGLSKMMDKSKYEIIVISNFLAELIVYYGDIEITNTAEITHTLRGVYVRFELEFNKNEQGLRLKRIELKRTTFEKRELYGNPYLFSHLSSNDNLTGWQGEFCYGDTLFDEYIHNLKCKFNKVYEFIYLPERFKSYLSWESIEGVPYQHISGLNTKKYRSYESNLNLYASYLDGKKKFITKYLIDNENFQEFEYDIDNDKNLIISDISKWNIKDDFINLWRKLQLPLVIYKNGDYYKDTDIENKTVEDRINKFHGKVSLTFNGKAQLINILPGEENTSEEDEFTIYPNDLTLMLKDFSLQIEQEIIRNKIYGKR